MPSGMTTLLEIESAVATLPVRDQRKLLKKLSERLSTSPAGKRRRVCMTA